MKRYMIIAPVKGGEAWWNIIDIQSGSYFGGEQNFAVAQFSIHMPGAESEATDLCARLNQANPAKD